MLVIKTLHQMSGTGIKCGAQAVNELQSDFMKPEFMSPAQEYSQTNFATQGETHGKPKEIRSRDLSGSHHYR